MVIGTDCTGSCKTLPNDDDHDGPIDANDLSITTNDSYLNVYSMYSCHLERGDL